MMPASALPILPATLPRLVQSGDKSQLSAPIALAMLKAGLITDTDLVGVYNEKNLVEAVLTRWWEAKTSSLTLFQWNLHVQLFTNYYGLQTTVEPVFCLTVKNDDIPQRSLALRVGELETLHPGFGQTVLAVLYDALKYLPLTWTPRSIMDMASWMYWQGLGDEEEWIKANVGEGGYASREEFLNDIGPSALITYADLLGDAPEWLPAAKRVCRREDLECAASSTLGKNVIAACDRIHALVHSPDFHLTSEKFDVQLQADSTQAAIFLRWNADDLFLRVIDDYMHGAYESGEGINVISANAVAPLPKYMRMYTRDMEEMLGLAKAVEDLILLISTPAGDAS